MEVFVVAHRRSGIQNAAISVEGFGFRERLVLNAGGSASRLISPSPLTALNTTNMQISVTSRRRVVGVYADNIPIDSEIYVEGIDADQFSANIRHQAVDPRVPPCTLRCSPYSIPSVGPGCIDCDVGRLRFRVCC
jgi:hypothetical protein